jgi:hypothetical protein
VIDQTRRKKSRAFVQSFIENGTPTHFVETHNRELISIPLNGTARLIAHQRSSPRLKYSAGLDDFLGTSAADLYILRRNHI